MTWMSALYETYERCSRDPKFQQGVHRLLPPGHITQNVHIEVAIDGEGNFLRARLIGKDPTVIPATEKSAGRTSGLEAHPLSDKLMYCAGDFGHFTDGESRAFSLYFQQLRDWSESPYVHPKILAVKQYVSQRRLVADLVKSNIVLLDQEQKLLTIPAKGAEGTSDIFKYLTRKEGEFEQGSAFIRWVVETPGDPDSTTWNDPSLISSWQQYLALRVDDDDQVLPGLCYVSGREGILARQHPKRIRHGGDNAKLVSSNDKTNFTFLGRFTDTTGNQACQVALEVTEKAHNALRWLIARQGSRIDEQTFVAWSTSGKQIPQPFVSTLQLFQEIDPALMSPISTHDSVGDVGQMFARKLRKLIAGYAAQLPSDDSVAVLGIDAATPGRMSVIYWHVLRGSEFLARLQDWHNSFAWSLSLPVQGQGKVRKGDAITIVEAAPSPRDIVYAAYSVRGDDDPIVRRSIQRIIPCIMEGRPLPYDFVQNAVRRSCNAVAHKDRCQWENTLGTACALFKGHLATHVNLDLRRNFSMTLERDRTTRDYLYGRLLAIAEKVESVALSFAGETRDTTAMRLMQRFSERPCSTWRTIELQLAPYKARIRARMPGYLVNLMNEIDGVFALFEVGDFQLDTPLTGEFLLGYHCQRRELQRRKDDEVQSEIENTRP